MHRNPVVLADKISRLCGTAFKFVSRYRLILCSVVANLPGNPRLPCERDPQMTATLPYRNKVHSCFTGNK